MFFPQPNSVLAFGASIKKAQPVHELDLPAAIDLLAKQTDSINNLWTVYVVATFAAGGFNGLDGVTGKLRLGVAAALTVAFLAFTIGHASMISHELIARATLGMQIMDTLDSAKPQTQFYASMKAFTKVADVPWRGIAVHILIDACVLTAIWMRTLIGWRRAPRE